MVIVLAVCQCIVIELKDHLKAALKSTEQHKKQRKDSDTRFNTLLQKMNSQVLAATHHFLLELLCKFAM